MAADFAATVEKAVSEKQIAGGAAIVVDSTGNTLFSKAFGYTSVDETARPFTFDTTFWIASSTKLLTSICVLQCVEKGLLGLDDDVSDLLPEWKAPQIVTGFEDDGKPVLVPAKNMITLRRLLTHSSGMSYSGMNPSITKYREHLKLPAPTGVMSDLVNPLVFDPGTGWEYGVGIDWAGHLVEKVTGMKLRDYAKKHVFAPLEMTYTTFTANGDEAVMSRMVGRVGRSPTGELIKEESGMYLVKTTQDDFGGSGSYSCAQDYIKVLTSLLANDGKLLNGEGYKELFRGQLENPQAFTAKVNTSPFGPFLAPGYPRGEETKWNYGLGGAIVDKEIPGQASKGTLFWSGLPNNYWFIDQQNGVAGYYASWLLPPGDAVTGKMFQALQRAAIKEAAKL